MEFEAGVGLERGLGRVAVVAVGRTLRSWGGEEGGGKWRGEVVGV